MGEILGIDFKTFTQLVYQNTNTSLQFLTATDTNRKKFLIDLLKLDDYVSYFETFKEGVRVATQEVTVLNAKTDTIVKWLNDNKLESIDVLSKVNLPKISEEDEKRLRQLQIDFENISEKNKKINDNNLYKEQLRSLDIQQARADLETYPEIKDTDRITGQLGAWKQELTHEVNMRDKYEVLRNAETQECPTCDQPIDMRSLISATAPLICFSPEALVHWWVLSSLLSSLESPPWLFSITGALAHFYLSTVKTKGRALSEKISKLWIFTNGGFPFWKLLLY